MLLAAQLDLSVSLVCKVIILCENACFNLSFNARDELFFFRNSFSGLPYDGIERFAESDGSKFETVVFLALSYNYSDEIGENIFSVLCVTVFAMLAVS